MTKTFAAVAILAALLLSCASVPTASETLHAEPWHTSPGPDTWSGTLYPLVPWSAVLKLRVGMSSAEADALTGMPLQWYLHPVNAILYTTDPSGRDVEVALRLSEAKDVILGVSFKLSAPSERTPPAPL